MPEQHGEHQECAVGDPDILQRAKKFHYVRFLA
jgi:hypothetical protein